MSSYLQGARRDLVVSPEGTLGTSLMNQLTLGHGTVSLVSSRFVALYVLGVRGGSTVSGIDFLLFLAATHLSTGVV